MVREKEPKIRTERIKHMKNRSESNKLANVVSTGQTNVVGIQRGECFFRTYRCFFDYLKKNHDEYFKTFKSIMVDSLGETLINDIIKEISEVNAPDRRSRIFYHANYAQGVSAFLGKVKTACERRGMNAALLDCVGGYKTSFQALNEHLLQKMTNGEDLVTKEPKLNEVYDDIKKAFQDELKGNPHGKKVVLLDHMDRFFIEQFEERIKLQSESGKPETNDFSLCNIFKLREFWCRAIIKLNDDGIHCIATVQTSLEAIFGEFSTTKKEGDPWGRNRVSSIWRDNIAAYSGGYFCEIRKYLNGKVGDKNFQHNREVTECRSCYFYFPEAKINVSQSSELNTSINKLLKIANDGPWLFCLSLHHAVKPTDDGRRPCANWNKKLKHYYRNTSESRGERSLLHDYLRAFPLYVGEIIAEQIRQTGSNNDMKNVCAALEESWEKSENQFQKNITDLLESYGKLYEEKRKSFIKQLKKKEPNNCCSEEEKRKKEEERKQKAEKALSYNESDGNNRKTIKTKVLLKDRKVKKKLVKRLPKVLRGSIGKNQLAKIIVNQNIFSRDEYDENRDDGNKKYIYYATSFFHYLYSDEKIKIKK